MKTIASAECQLAQAPNVSQSRSALGGYRSIPAKPGSGLPQRFGLCRQGSANLPVERVPRSLVRHPLSELHPRAACMRELYMSR